MDAKTLTTHPETTERTLDSCELASRDYPSVELETGETLHVFFQAGEWHVWLNTEASDFDGLCIAVADTREAAEADARSVALAILTALERASS